MLRVNRMYVKPQGDRRTFIVQTLRDNEVIGYWEDSDQVASYDIVQDCWKKRTNAFTSVYAYGRDWILRHPKPPAINYIESEEDRNFRESTKIMKKVNYDEWKKCPMIDTTRECALKKLIEGQLNGRDYTQAVLAMKLYSDIKVTRINGGGWEFNPKVTVEDYIMSFRERDE